MKKQEKLDMLRNAAQERLVCRCEFTYAPDARYYYPIAVNDKFLLGQMEDDFLLNGCWVQKVSQLKKVGLMEGCYRDISEMLGVADRLKRPEIDITSWQTIFNSLKAMDCFVAVEDEPGGQYVIGLIEKTFKNNLHFKAFGADGVWGEDSVVIPYSQITTVSWGTRYALAWERYLRKRGRA